MFLPLGQRSYGFWPGTFWIKKDHCHVTLCICAFYKYNDKFTMCKKERKNI